MDEKSLTKKSLLNFLFFLLLFLVGNFLLWPKYYDQKLSAEIFSKLSSQIHSEKYPKVVIPKEILSGFKKPCNKKDKRSKNQYCLDFDSVVTESLFYLKEKYHQQVGKKEKGMKDFVEIKWENREEKKMGIEYLEKEGQVVITGDAKSDYNQRRFEEFRDILENLLLNSQILAPRLQSQGDFQLKRKINLVLKIPFDHKGDLLDIQKEFRETADTLLAKLPYFEFINISPKLVKTSEMQNLELDDVRNSLMTSLPDDFTSIQIFLTPDETQSPDFVQTNDRKFGSILSLNNLGKEKITQTLSFFLLKTLDITPNDQIFHKAQKNQISLKIPAKFLKKEMDLFKHKEEANKRKLILSHLAATGWLNSEEEGLQKMQEYSNKSIKEISNIDRLEKPIDQNFYQQMDFPIIYQLALFFTFYTPFISSIGRVVFQFLKFKIRGKI